MAKPKNIGKYRIQGLIGRGAMGAVYLAHDPMIDRQVAIKILSTDYTDREVERRFLNEARIIGRLTHPNIAAVYDIGSQDGEPYIVQEYVDGESVQRMIRRSKPLSAKRKLDYLRQIAGGMGYAHERDVIHRDLKPANVLISREQQAKILDFGIATLSNAVGEMTGEGIVVGTPNYISPEMIQGERATIAADVFSFGVLAYEFLTFEKPFSGDSLPQIMFSIVQNQPPPITDYWPECPRSISAIIDRCLEKAPENRYPTLAPVEKLLADVLEQELGLDEIIPPGLEEDNGLVAFDDSPGSSDVRIPVAGAPLPQPPSSLNSTYGGVSRAMGSGSGDDPEPAASEPPGYATPEAPAPAVPTVAAAAGSESGATVSSGTGGPDGPSLGEVTMIADEPLPTGFFDADDTGAGDFSEVLLQRTGFFSSAEARYKRIEGSLDFYRSHLDVEYRSLLQQANVTFYLWIACVSVGFLTFTAGIGAMMFGYVQQGAISATSTSFVYFIQRVFQQREDHYRKQAKAKYKNLEYGNKWLLVIQSIDSIEDPLERAARQARLVEVLIDKLRDKAQVPGMDLAALTDDQSPTGVQ